MVDCRVLCARDRELFPDHRDLLLGRLSTGPEGQVTHEWLERFSAQAEVSEIW